ncbi:hypothetical protein PSTT_09707 [Puccinia striiformis]|uniref:Uncharacterized protein n=1 Tax=Puccinia striiformis TaxID=27350 RepID=A0A2S4V7E6_9BASI|nr:hypothetical protein PSTT_09707 [Puccinia striiformis]
MLDIVVKSFHAATRMTRPNGTKPEHYELKRPHESLDDPGLIRPGSHLPAHTYCPAGVGPEIAVLDQDSRMMIPIFCQSTITWIFTRTTKRQAAVFDSLALHFRQMIQKHTFSFVDQRDLIANKIRKVS